MLNKASERGTKTAAALYFRAPAGGVNVRLVSKAALKIRLFPITEPPEPARFNLA